MKNVPKNMRLTGMFLFRDAFLESINSNNPMCVVHTAHAAEILLKARIAQEHPLLIFSKLPKSDPTKNTLTLIDLLETGRTLSYEELPEQLWATTGIKIEQISRYKEFGRLRNQIVHFSMANAKDLDILALGYSLEVLDPLVESFWGKSVIDFIKNDHHFTTDFKSGMFEDSIRQKGFFIDVRLRRLLGEDSREGWENMQMNYEEMRELDRSKTKEDFEEEYKAHLVRNNNPFEEEEHQWLREQEDNWKNFLSSF